LTRAYTRKTVQPMEPVEAPEVSELDEVIQVAPITHTMVEGENILTVAKRYLPEGKTRQDYAKQLLKNNKSFAVGKVINLV